MDKESRTREWDDTLADLERRRAAARAMGTAMEVSSVHSPGAQPKPPPPIMSTGASSGSGGPNS